ncbi:MULTISPECIES: zinc dependent phospholipase C family protein [Bacillus cereus group]|uniref:zinc dependent phospholipase C family protein n=1 Tax=Bacillus TaxID=1386 RepID=UPI0001A1D22E|nr:MULTISPECIES: zinc dependent phospholipase C family protein [Bacillus cereus group]EEM68651.1 Phospholipase C [Bacillus thuringiensis serovar andalousiensis BGSC 4AW1]MEB9626457.1 zinc dependent phospholipase C family protein [Bacillus anthracis]
MKFKRKLCKLALSTTLASISTTIIPTEILGEEINENNQNHSRQKRWSAENPFDVNQNTHLWIARHAIDMINRDSEYGPSQLHARTFFTFHNLKNAFEQGLYDADHLDQFNDGGTGSIYIEGLIRGGWKSHFYDPDTGKNYKGESSPTARTEGAKYFHLAGDYLYNQNPEKAMYYLGVATHYFTDVTQPMHAANFTNVDSLNSARFHSAFEEYVTEIQHNFNDLQNTMAGDYDLLVNPNSTIFSYAPGEWIHYAAANAKVHAKNIIRPEIFDEQYGYVLTLPNFKLAVQDIWKNDSGIQTAIHRSLNDAPALTAGFLNMWFRKNIPNNWSQDAVKGLARGESAYQIP